MKSPYNGIIDVSMTWQKHPTAKMIPYFLKVYGNEDPYPKFRKIVESISEGGNAGSMWRFQCHWHFTLNIQRKVANKAFEIAFQLHI